MTKVTSISVLGALALLVSAGIATAGAVAKGDFQTCGKRAVADVPGPGSYKLILKVKRASCDAGQKVARKYFKKAGSIVPNVGNVEFVQHYRCVQKNYYSPFEPSFECRNKARGRVVKGLFPPENARAAVEDERPLTAHGDKPTVACDASAGAHFKVAPRKCLMLIPSCPATGACYIAAERMKWNWGHKQARGHGKRGFTMAGLYPVRIKLIKPITRCGHTVFSKAKIKGEAPSGDDYQDQVKLRTCPNQFP